MASPAAILEIFVNAQTGAASGKLTKLNSQMKASEVQANRSSNAIGGKLTKGMKLLGVAAAAGAAYGLYKAVDAGAQFEKQMDSLGAVSEASTRQMKRLEKQALALGESTQYTANEVALAQTELAKGGLTLKQILGGGLKASLSLAAAGELDLGQAAETTVNAMKLFGLEGSQSMKVADALATAANKTTADVGDFALALKQGGGVAKMAGLSFNETVTVLEALAEAGYKGSDAGTSVKSFFLALTKDSKKSKEAIAELGLQLFTAQGRMKSLPAVSRELQRAFGDLTEKEFLNKGGVIAGSDAIRALYALYEVGPKKLEGLEVANAKSGTAMDVARKKMDNLSGDVEQLTGALETQGIKLERVLAPGLRAATQWLTGLIQGLDKFDVGEMARQAGVGGEELSKFGKAAENLGRFWDKYLRPIQEDALGGVIAALKGSAQVIRGVVRITAGVLTGDWAEAWKGVKDIFSGGVKFLLGILTYTTAPIRAIAGQIGSALQGPVTAAFDAVAVAAGAISTWIGRAASNVAGFVTSFLPLRAVLAVGSVLLGRFLGLITSIAGAVLPPAVRMLGALAQILGAVLVPAVKAASRIFASVFVAALHIAIAATHVLVTAVKGVAAIVANVVGLVSNLLRGDWAGAWRNAKELVASVWQTITSLLKAGWNLIKAIFSSGINVVKTVVTSGFGAVLDAARNLVDPMKSLFSNAWDAITGIFESGADAVMSVVEDVVGVLNKIPGVPDVNLGGSSEGDVKNPSKGGLGKPRHRKARGGPINLGAPSGDSVPALLERGEYVLNRKAVAAVGKGRLDKLNFDHAPRYSVGSFIGNAADTVTSLPGKAVDAVGDLAGKGAGYFIDQLPKPNLPEPFAQLGPYLIEQVTDYIKNGFQDKKLGNLTMGKGALGFTGAPANMKQLGDNRYVDSHTLAVTALVDKMFGLTMTDGYRDAATAEQYPSGLGTLHHDGSPANPGATDSAGPMGAMRSALAWSKSHIAGLQEAQIDNVAGWNMHLGFFKLGGLIQKLAKGGLLQKLADGGSVKGPWAGSSIDKTYPKSDGYSGVTVPPYVIKALAEWSGLPGVTMEQITQGESMGHAGMDISDPPGRSRGLYAINDHYNGQFGATAMRNPILNTLAAATLAKAAGGPNANIWHGSSHVTGWDLHYDGDPVAVAKHIGGSGESGKDEEVKAWYGGARTDPIHFGGIPKSEYGIKKELAKRTGELTTYRKAALKAHKAHKPKTEQAINENLRALEKRVRELERAKALVRREKAKKAITKRFGKAISKLSGFSTMISERERDFDSQSQLAQQIVDLEPIMAEVPEKATNAQREALEKTHLADLTSYIGTEEEPAYKVLMERANDWRNTILDAENAAAGNWQHRKTVGGIEGNLEDKVIGLGNEIDRDQEFIKKVAADVGDWHKKNGKKALPKWLKDEVDKQHKLKANLPILRFEEEEARTRLGEAREGFYPGMARIKRPSPPMEGTGSFEDALNTVQGIHWPKQHEHRTALPFDRLKGNFGGVIWDVQTTIADLGMKIRDAAVQGGGGGDTEGKTPREEWLEEELTKKNQRTLVYERQKPIIDAYEAAHPVVSNFAGMFAKGGSIAAGQWGIAGEAGPEIVQGPAQVFSNADSAGMVGGSTAAQTINLEVLVLDGAVDVSKIQAIANGEAVKVTKKQGKGARSLGAQRAGRLG